MRRVYLDHATTTPLLPEVLEAMLPYLRDRFGNPSAPHARGAAARAAVERARSDVAALLGAAPEEIVFTASATEANNLAIKGVAWAAGRKRRGLAAARTEHISILHPLRSLEKQGFSVTLLPVDGLGRVDAENVRRGLGQATGLLSVAHASAEVGTLQDLPALCRAAREAGILVHSDATVTAGAVPLPSGEDGPDLLTLAPHLFYGPQGVGALRVRRGVRLAPLIEGGIQENGLRAGTEPVAAIVGFGAAARLAAAERERRARRAAERAAALQRILLALDGLVPTGDPERRVPGLVSVCVGGVDAEALLTALDAEGVEAASGSACTTEVRKPSHVLEAMGVDPVLARGALTFSFGETNQDGDAAAAGAALAGAVSRLRALSPLG